MTDDTLRDRLEVALCHALCTSDTADHDPTVHRAVNAALAVWADGDNQLRRQGEQKDDYIQQLERRMSEERHTADQLKDEHAEELRDKLDEALDRAERAETELSVIRDRHDYRHDPDCPSLRWGEDGCRCSGKTGRALSQDERERTAYAEERDELLNRVEQHHSDRDALQRQIDELQARIQEALAYLAEDETPPAIRCDQAAQSLDPPHDDLAGSNKWPAPISGKGSES